jgi:uncharacterized protein YjbI with pentapeptide repeats
MRAKWSVYIMPAMRCNEILSSAAVLKKGTPTLDGVAISADFHTSCKYDTFSDVQFEDCTFGKRLSGVTFKNCNFYNCNFLCDFYDCAFDNCKIVECGFWRLVATSVALGASEIVESEFRYCFLNAITGGVIADGSLHFCKLSEFQVELENCSFEHVSINEEV